MSLLNNGLVPASGDYEIEQSVRLRSDATAYFDWTPTSAGNRKTWTFSTWVKRGKFIDGTVYSCMGSTTQFRVIFNSDVLRVFSYSGGYQLHLQTSAVYRDTSAWYHFVIEIDTTQATSSDRAKLYVNGDQVTQFGTAVYPSQNADLYANMAEDTGIGATWDSGASTWTAMHDGYLAETHFIDGTAEDATAFGEFDSNGVWKPKSYTGSYGTNGFYLPYKPTTQADGFNAVTYTGNGTSQSVDVGMGADLVWIKSRSTAAAHVIFDSVRGIDAANSLVTNSTDAEADYSSIFGVGSTSNGFSVDYISNTSTNGAGLDFVAWCWDAGSASPASNTDGTITSTVKANTDYGFSIVSYTGTGANATVGHGLDSAPDMMIVKNRDSAVGWVVYHSANTAEPETDYLVLNTTDITADLNTVWNDTLPTSSVFSVGTNAAVNQSSADHITYCFHSVAGYSDFGSYTGTGAAGNTVTTGFRPAFVLVKRTDTGGANWVIWDSAREAANPINKYLFPNNSDAEAESSTLDIEFNNTGFTINGTESGINGSGQSFIYMAFADTRDAAFYFDASGNKNNWTPNNIDYTSEGSTYDIMLDSPTDNYATLNPLEVRGNSSFQDISDGNLKVTSNAGNAELYATGFPLSGKQYFEWTFLGITASPVSFTGINFFDQQYRKNGDIYVDGVLAGNFAVLTTNTVVGIAVDKDAGTIQWYNNGVLQTTTSPANSLDFPYTYMDSAGESFAYNFGQQPFAYTPPTGYLALSTSNLPEPAIANPAEHFNTVLWAGVDSTAGRSVTGVGFQPDFVWFKRRDAVSGNLLYDSIRGVGPNTELVSESTTFEGGGNPSEYDYLSSFDSDGFTSTWSGLNSAYYFNTLNAPYLAWNWKAGGTGVTNTDGSITSTVSANPTAGFSIVSFNAGAAATGQSVGHGLGAMPDIFIMKNRDASSSWLVWSSSFANTAQGYLELQGTAQVVNDARVWDNNAPDSSVIYVESGYTITANNDAIAYCFSAVEGYSAFGSYTGNGSTDGPFVHTGFRPAYVMIKCSSISPLNWFIYDNKRGAYNVIDNPLLANSSNAEITPYSIDLLSNGFKIKTTDSNTNASGQTYIYMAFAESPFKYANAR